MNYGLSIQTAARLLVVLAACLHATAGPVYPLKQSATGRYLVDQHNAPFLMIGDAPQSLMVNLSETDAANYLSDRQKFGFNTLWVNLLCNTYTGGRISGSTIDGILPFTNTITGSTNYDLSTPNPAYFAHVDRVITMAANDGLVILLDPIETGGYLQTMRDNGTARCRAYGQFLGSRYKAVPNIIWLNGNDFQSWQTAGDDAVAVAVAQGIQDKDTNHLQSVELNYTVSSSLDDANWASIVSLNAAYTYSPTYAEVLHAYAQSTTPVFMVEANYEFETNPNTDGGSPHNLRLQEYWSLLSGACGHLYGNHFTWSFLPGWQSKLDTVGITQLGYAKALFEPRAWYRLVPDTAHLVVTSGYGTFSASGSIDNNDYVTAASSSDGTLVIAYMPTARKLTVDMSKLSGLTAARWYDPGNGKYVAIAGSPFPNTGSRDFTPPGRNSAGDSDWILLLEFAPIGMLPSPGSYYGGFSTDGADPGSEGLLVATVTSSGRYTGRVLIGARRYGFSGILGTESRIGNIVARRGNSPLELNLNFGFGDQADELLGQITNGDSVATLQAGRAVFGSRTNPAAYASRFTLRIPGQPGDSTLPAGDGIGVGRLLPSGILTFGATLADGTPFSQGSALTKDNQWALYAPLYSGSGSVFSTLAFDSNQPGSDISGSLAWIKPANASTHFYKSGFTNQNLATIGSIYSRPPAGGTLLALTNGFMEFSGGNLIEGFTNPVSVGPGSRVADASGERQLSMSVSSASGLFVGRVTDPAGGKPGPFKGVVLSKLNIGCGFLLGTNQSSQVLFTP